jgi:predicted DNA-binding transcriptional regulator AlpA
MKKNKPESVLAPEPRRQLLSLAEVRRRFGDGEAEVSEATIYRWSATGVLPRPIKIGHLNRWWEDELELALAAMERGGPTAKPAVREPVAVEKTKKQPRHKQPQDERPGPALVRKWRPGGPGRPPKGAAAE